MSDKGKLYVRRAWLGVLFMILFLLLFACPVKGTDRNKLSETSELSEGEESGEENSGEKSALSEKIDLDLLPSVQIQIKEEYVEVIPAVKELPVDQEKRERKNILMESMEAIPPWLGAATIAGSISLPTGVIFLYLSLCTCRIYWLDRKRKRFLGFVRFSKKEDGYRLNIPESMLENSQSVEYVAVFPVLFRHVHRYEPVTVTIGGEEIESYVEKSISFQAGLSIIG